MKNFQQKDCIFQGGKNHYKNSLVGWFAFVNISPSLSHIATRVCFALILFLGAQINSSLLGVPKTVFASFFLNLCPFILQIIFILMKKRWLSVLQYETSSPRHECRQWQCEVFSIEDSHFFIESIHVSLKMMHLFTPHKPENTNQIGAMSLPPQEVCKLRIQG